MHMAAGAAARCRSVDLREVPIALIGERYGCLRMQHREAERVMVESLLRYGQISPVVVCEREEKPELIDGFKRLSAARQLPGMDVLLARVIEADDRSAKAAIFCLNRISGRTHELEEAWIIQALVREDGLEQQEVAELLGRHKSWVCRRLALLERLCPAATADLRVGLLSPTAARELLRLPHGNQAEILPVIGKEALSSSEVKGVVDLLLSAPDRQKQRFVLEHAREALARDRGIVGDVRDPRLSEVGNRLQKRLSLLLELLPRMENALRQPRRTELLPTDLALLAHGLKRLSRNALSVAEAVEDLEVKDEEDAR